MTGQTSRRGAPGRPSKGDRRAIGSKLPLDLADRVIHDAEAAKMSLTDYVALIVAERYDYELPEVYGRPATASPAGTDALQDEIDLEVPAKAS